MIILLAFHSVSSVLFRDKRRSIKEQNAMKGHNKKNIGTMSNYKCLKKAKIHRRFLPTITTQGKHQDSFG